VGEAIVDSLNLYTKVEGGFASIRDVTTMQTEDHQHSFFLAETQVVFCPDNSSLKKLLFCYIIGI